MLHANAAVAVPSAPMTPSAAPFLGLEEVHIWRIDLLSRHGGVPYPASLFAAEEIARAERFRFNRDRRVFLAARGALRTILGRYLQTNAASLTLATSRYGKPCLASEGRGPALHFNVSHSQDLAVIAFCRARPVGIDIEWMKPGEVDRDTAAQVFSRSEMDGTGALASPEQRAQFYRCWTRKEAVLKALGLGLSMPLDRFDVTFTAHEAPAVTRCDWNPCGPGDWWLADLQPAPGYFGALAAEGTPRAIHWVDFDSGRAQV